MLPEKSCFRGIELQEIASTRSCSFDEEVEQIQNFATERKISRAMVAYKLFRSDYIGENRWRELNARFQQEWADLRVKTTNKDEGRSRRPELLCGSQTSSRTGHFGADRTITCRGQNYIHESWTGAWSEAKKRKSPAS